MTDQELKDLVASLSISQAKTDKQIQELKESQKKTDEQMKKTDEQMKKTDEQMKKTDEQMKKTDELLQETDDRIRKLSKLYGDSENNKGEEVEEFFYRYFQKNKKISDIDFDEVDRNIISSDGSEHDIVLINGKVSALISVKYKLKEKDIDYLVDTELVRLKNFYDRLGSHHKLYGGVASYVISPKVEAYAKERGVFAFSRAGDNVKSLNQKDFTPVVI